MEGLPNTCSQQCTAAILARIPAIVVRPDSPYRQDADDQKAIKKHKVLFKGKFFFKVQVSMRNAAAARYDDRTHMMLWRAGVPGVSMPTQCIGG